MRRLGVGLCLLLCVGCTAKKPWQGLYVKSAYMYGRIEAKAEALCAAPTPTLVEVCREAQQDRLLIQQIVPQIDAELAKSSPDWGTIEQYIGLIFSLAVKFLP